MSKVQRTVIFVEFGIYNEIKGAAHRDIMDAAGKIDLSISHFDVLHSDISVRCTSLGLSFIISYKYFGALHLPNKTVQGNKEINRLVNLEKFHGFSFINSINYHLPTFYKITSRIDACNFAGF